jgi:hypothetical protein
MTRQQRMLQRTYFEKLCFLRDLYARRGPYDSASCTTVEDAVRAAEAILAATERPGHDEREALSGSLGGPTA